MEQPRYHLEGIVHTRAETPEDYFATMIWDD